MLTAGVGRFQFVKVRHRVGPVGNINKKSSRLSVPIGILDYFIEKFARFDFFPSFTAAWIDKFKIIVGLNRAHKLVGESDGNIEIFD